jgi:hypothetical protein
MTTAFALRIGGIDSNRTGMTISSGGAMMLTCALGE